jgi:hypothetical protein
MMQADKLKIEYLPTDELCMYEGNANTHSDRQVEQIAESIEEFDFADPIAAWHDAEGNSVLVEGHGRLMAAQKLGIEELPVIYLDYMSDEERRAYTLVHNQLTMNTGFQEDMLQAELSKIQGIDMGMFDFQDISDVEFDVAPDIQEREVREVRKTFFLVCCTDEQLPKVRDMVAEIARGGAEVDSTEKWFGED